MSHEILFICTGNYYRSRFAEALFNHHASDLGLPWSAFSRGLAIHLAPTEPPLSEHTHERLETLGIPLTRTALRSVSLTETDLQRAARIVALQDTEHRPMVREQFPHWEERIHFWEVADIGFLTPERALQRIEDEVKNLLTTLAAHHS